MELIELIPKDKHDHDSIDKLEKLSYEEIKPIIPNLLEWLQDMNWPVASSVADVLRPFKENFTHEIIKILNTNDRMWEFWILINFCRDTSNPLLLKEIERLAKYPTMVEIEDGVQEEAIAILNGAYQSQS